MSRVALVEFCKSVATLAILFHPFPSTPWTKSPRRSTFAHATLPAMVSEDGPIAAAELLLHAGQVSGGGGDGAARRQTVVADGHAIWHAVRHRLEFGSLVLGGN